MKKIPSFQVCYLIFLPYQGSLPGRTEEEPISMKGAPYFYDLDIGITTLEEKKITFEDTVITVTPQIIDTTILMTECYFDLPDPLGKTAAQRLYRIQAEIQNLISNGKGLGSHDIYEEYSIFLIRDLSGSPDSFMESHSSQLAQLLRPLDRPLNKYEIQKTLKTRLHYTDQDLAVIDWNGAILISPEEEFTSDIDLLKIGNYQLTRYRLIDQTLDENLEKLQKLIVRPKKSILPQRNQHMFDIVNQQLSLLLSFEKIDKSILLIGDWYSSRLYRNISEELYLEEWKATVNNKLQSLGSIQEVVSQSLTFSWSRFFDYIQIIGWLILLIGYFFLFYLDLKRY